MVISMMYTLPIISIAFLLPSIIGQVSFDSMKHDILVKDFATCAGQSDLPNSYENLTLVMEPGTNIILVNGLLTIRETIRNGTTLRFNILKCKTKYQESCVHYTSMEVGDLCSRMIETGRAWSDFFSHIESFTACPLAPGSYVIKDAPLDSTSMQSAANMYVGYWRMKTEYSYEGKVRLCVEASAEIKKRRKSNNKG